MVRLLDSTNMIQKSIEESKKVEFFSWLSTTPVAHQHHRIHTTLLSGSGAWLMNHTKYKDWIESSSSSILLIHGVRGCGKSSLLSAVVNSLSSTPVTTAQSGNQFPVPCLYFYCSSSPSETDRASPSSILRAIIKQLATYPDKNSVNQIVWSKYEERLQSVSDIADILQLEIDECVELLLDLLAQNAAYIGIDAVDELAEDSRAVLLSALQRIQTQSASIVKILLTSRDNGQIHALLPSVAKIRISASENQEDVKSFIQKELAEAMSQCRLLHGEASRDLVEAIAKSLLLNAGEMFLWVKLQVDFLCRQKSEAIIHSILQAGLTDSLDKMYGKIVESILAMDPASKEITRHVFSWLLFSEESLTVGALCSAISWGLVHANQSKDQILKDLTRLCFDLVLVDASTNAIGFCHSSVRDFFKSHELFSPNLSHQILALGCLRQCTAGTVTPFTASDSPVSEFYQYAALFWGHHVQQTVFKNKVIDEMFQFIFEEDEHVESLSFTMWLGWIREARNLLPQYDERRRDLACLLTGELSPLFVASVFGIPKIVEHMLDTAKDIDIEAKNEQGATCLYLASAFGHNSIVSTLITRKANIEVKCGGYGSPLQVACFRGHIDVVRTLTRAGAKPWEEASFSNALDAVFHGDNEKLAMTLIEDESIIQNSEQYDFALCRSAEVGFRTVFDWLSRPKVAKAFSRDAGKEGGRQEALSRAIKDGHTAILRSFLKANPEGMSLLPKEAVSIAAAHGRVDMVVFLHELVFNIESQGPYGSPLRNAAFARSERIVCLLVGWGADILEVWAQGDAIQASASKGHTHIIRYLAAEGAQVNQISKPWGTCLQAAAYHGHLDTVCALLDLGADMYQPGRYRDALHAALEGGQGAIASFFISKGYVSALPPLEKEAKRRMWKVHPERRGPKPAM